jgi:hypothetical protein
MALADEAREVWAQVRLGQTCGSLSLRNRGHWARMARVRTSASVSAGGRPSRCKGRRWCRFHHSSTTTYRETRKVSRSMCLPSVRIVEAVVVRCGFGRICSRAGRRLGAGSRVASRHDPEHGKRGANRSTSSSGASLSIGMCALAFDTRFRSRRTLSAVAWPAPTPSEGRSLLGPVSHRHPARGAWPGRAPPTPESRGSRARSGAAPGPGSRAG